jgi:hypothetical protein
MRTQKLLVTMAATLLLISAAMAPSTQAAQLQLSWSAPTANADGTPLADLASYNVYRCEGAGCVPVLLRNVGNVTTYTDTGLLENTLYRYQVTALDTSGNESDGSNIAEAVSRPDGTCTTDGLLAHWTFDDGAGTRATDASGNGYHGTLINMESSSWVAGHLGTALDFDGINELVSAGSPSGLDDLAVFTVTAWINPYAIVSTRWNTVLSKLANGAGKAFGVRGQDRLALRLDRTSAAVIVQSVDYTIDTGTWQFVAATVDGEAVHLYKDGAEVTYAVRRPGSGEFVSEAAGNLRIGARSASAGQFNGKIDDVRLYNRVLSLAELQCLANM